MNENKTALAEIITIENVSFTMYKYIFFNFVRF